MLIFNKIQSTPIVLEKAASQAVRLAAEDLRRDLCLLSGKENGFPFCEEKKAFCIEIRTVPDGTEEAYTVEVTEKSVRITGSDVLGTVYGIYAFSHKCLGFVPVWRVTDLVPEVREELALSPAVITSAPRAVRFRGWFLNDEDLLTEWKISGGKRDIDYPFYGDVMDTGVLDMILETALRLEINLMIPSSFVDIDNPDEEKLIAATTARGLYISQHHVEPLGVSYFAADNYLKKRGYTDERVSFIQNRARMEEIWRYYAEKWAKYGKQVIWQLGLRGKADQSVWRSDPSVPESAASRGAIISDAIGTEHRIVSEVLGTEDFHSTATLWMEGAALYDRGYLVLPHGTVAVFSDIGYSQTFASDFYSTERKENERYGIYYHIGFWGEGPHLAEGCDLRKMVDSYRTAWEKQSLYYSILNVSNLRPLHFGAYFNAKCLASPTENDAQGFAESVLSDLFGEHAAAVAPILWAYYDAIADAGEDELRHHCAMGEFKYHPIQSTAYPKFPATDGFFHCRGPRIMQKDAGYTFDTPKLIEVLRRSIPAWETLRQKADACAATLPMRLREYFEKFLGFEISYMLHLTQWLVSSYDMVQENNAEKRTEYFENAKNALQSILEERKILEQGQWENWHRGDKKIGIANLMAITEETYREWKTKA